MENNNKIDKLIINKALLTYVLVISLVGYIKIHGPRPPPLLKVTVNLKSYL